MKVEYHDRTSGGAAQETSDLIGYVLSIPQRGRDPSWVS